MKRFLKILACALACGVLFVSQIAAETPEFSLDLGDDYLYFYEDSNLDKAAEITSLSEEDLDELFDDEELVMLALSKDNKRQIRVACYENEISEKIGNFSSRSYAEVRELSDELNVFATGGTFVSRDTVESADAAVNKYIVYSELHTDSGGDYMVTQYITVVDGAFWHITTYAPNHSNIPDVMPHFTVGVESSKASVVFYAVGAVFAVFAAVMLVMYFRERRAERQITIDE